MRIIRLFVVAFTIIGLVGGTFFYFRIFRRAELSQVVAAAPMVEPSQLAIYSHKHTLVKCQLCMPDEYVAGGRFALEKLYELDAADKSRTPSWHLIDFTPEYLELTSQNKDVKARVLSERIYNACLETIFNNYGSASDEAIVPASWQSKMSDPLKKYMVFALPVHSKVTVIGWVETTENGLAITDFASGGLSHKVIISIQPEELIENRLRGAFSPTNNPP
jgi:hypothetical protein